MATDISKVGNGFIIGGKAFIEPPVKFHFNGENLTIDFSEQSGLSSETVAYRELTISGQSPASKSAALTSLLSVFPKAKSGSGSASGSTSSSITMTDADDVEWTMGVSTAGTTTWTRQD